MNELTQIEFLKKFKQLLDDNPGFNVSFGCGCCGAGISYETNEKSCIGKGGMIYADIDQKLVDQYLYGRVS